MEPKGRGESSKGVGISGKAGSCDLRRSGNPARLGLNRSWPREGGESQGEISEDILLIS